MSVLAVTRKRGSALSPDSFLTGFQSDHPVILCVDWWNLRLHDLSACGRCGGGGGGGGETEGAAKSQRECPRTTTFDDRMAEAESNRGPSAYMQAA